MGVLTPTQRGAGEHHFEFWDPSLISRMAEVIDLKFVVLIEDWGARGPNKTCAKVGRVGSAAGSRTCFLILGPPCIFGTAAARDLKCCGRTRKLCKSRSYGGQGRAIL